MAADWPAILHELTLTLQGDLDRHRLFEMSVLGARRLLSAPFAAALSWDEARGEPILEARSSDESLPFLDGAELAPWVSTVFTLGARSSQGNLVASVRSPPLARTLRLEMVVTVPILGGGTVRGALLVGARRGPEPSFSEDAVRILEIYATVVGLALVSAETSQAALRRSAQTEALTGAFRDIAWAHDRETILQRGLDCATSILGADRAAIYLVNSRGDVTFAASRRLSRGYIEEVARRYRRSAGGLLNVERTPIFVADLATDPRSRPLHEAARREGVHTALIMPLMQRGQLYGALTLYHDLVWRYEPEDHGRARALADELAVALANATLHLSTQRQLASLRTLEIVARAAAEPGSAHDRAARVLGILVDRQAGRRAWVIDGAGSLVAAVGDETPPRAEILQAAQAAALAGGPLLRGAGPLLAAPLMVGRPLGALVLDPLPPIGSEPRAPTFFQLIADDDDHGPTLELAAAAALHLGTSVMREVGS